MNQDYPFLKVTKPDTAQYIIELKEMIAPELEQVCITIGRQHNNHIVLSDPQKKVSRHHCSIQYRIGRWWIVDEGSSNGTFLQRHQERPEIDVRSEQGIPLKNGDSILILGELDRTEQPLFWRLKFIDPEETNQVMQFQTILGLEYSLSQKILYRQTSRNRDEIYLRDRELALIDYMSRQNHQHQNQAVVCSYEEIIKAIWKDNDFGVDRKDVNHLVWRIRDKIESDSGEAQFLKTVRGQGYRLNIKIFS